MSILLVYCSLEDAEPWVLSFSVTPQSPLCEAIIYVHCSRTMWLWWGKQVQPWRFFCSFLCSDLWTDLFRSIELCFLFLAAVKLWQDDRFACLIYGSRVLPLPKCFHNLQFFSVVHMYLFNESISRRILSIYWINFLNLRTQYSLLMFMFSLNMKYSLLF